MSVLSPPGCPARPANRTRMKRGDCCIARLPSTSSSALRGSRRRSPLITISGTLSQRRCRSPSALQIEAAKRFGFSAQNVLDICQKLYETHKLITYPRSDSRTCRRSICRAPCGAERDRRTRQICCRSRWWIRRSVTAAGTIKKGRCPPRDYSDRPQFAG